MCALWMLIPGNTTIIQASLLFADVTSCGSGAGAQGMHHSAARLILHFKLSSHDLSIKLSCTNLGRPAKTELGIYVVRLEGCHGSAGEMQTSVRKYLTGEIYGPG